MPILHFTPVVDLPLVLMTVAVFLWNFAVWSASPRGEIRVDLPSRLPTAKRRLIVFFATIVGICWLVNLAVWVLYAVLFGFGLVSATVVGSLGGEMVFVAPPFLIREWCFGFPQMVLSPPDPVSDRVSNKPHDGDLLGKVGITVEPLRPAGSASFEGELSAVASAQGRWIDEGTRVIVTDYRDGVPCVAAHLEGS